MDNARTYRDSGFTLLEAMVAVTVLSLAIFGITVPFTVGAAGQADDARRTLANALAQEMMEEILAKPHDADDEAPLVLVACEKPRAEFTHMEDYAVLDEPAGRIEDMNGRVMRDTAATGLSRHTRVYYVQVGGQTLETPFLRVNVEMRYQGHTLLSLTRLVYCAPEEE